MFIFLTLFDVALILNNAKVGSQIAFEFNKLHQSRRETTHIVNHNNLQGKQPTHNIKPKEKAVSSRLLFFKFKKEAKNTKNRSKFLQLREMVKDNIKVNKFGCFVCRLFLTGLFIQDDCFFFFLTASGAGQ